MVLDPIVTRGPTSVDISRLAAATGSDSGGESEGIEEPARAAAVIPRPSRRPSRRIASYSSTLDPKPAPNIRGCVTTGRSASAQYRRLENKTTYESLESQSQFHARFGCAGSGFSQPTRRDGIHIAAVYPRTWQRRESRSAPPQARRASCSAC
jgi:hypothetical protein